MILPDVRSTACYEVRMTDSLNRSCAAFVNISACYLYSRGDSVLGSTCMQISRLALYIGKSLI